jgi:hypothetical protein
MRVFLVAFLLLGCISACAQRAEFIGYYVQLRETPDDTDVHILVSLDSVKEIKAKKIKGDRDLWMQVKSGEWIIKSADTVKDEYWLTLLFRDGTQEDIQFIPLYEAFPAPKWMKPIRYEVRIGNAVFYKERGKGGMTDRIRNNINSRKM